MRVRSYHLIGSRKEKLTKKADEEKFGSVLDVGLWSDRKRRMNSTELFSGELKIQAVAKRAAIDHRRLGAIVRGKVIPTSLELTRLSVLMREPFDVVWTHARKAQERYAKAHSKKVRDV